MCSMYEVEMLGVRMIIEAVSWLGLPAWELRRISTVFSCAHQLLSLYSALEYAELSGACSLAGMLETSIFNSISSSHVQLNFD